jgi:hypothetical protein
MQIGAGRMTVSAFSPTTPLRRALAAEIAFPGGGVAALTRAVG